MNKGIIEALKEEGSYLELRNGKRTLYWHHFAKSWRVAESARYARSRKLIIETPDENEAIHHLTKEQ